jgi:hypothetical protein
MATDRKTTGHLETGATKMHADMLATEISSEVGININEVAEVVTDSAVAVAPGVLSCLPSASS